MHLFHTVPIRSLIDVIKSVFEAIYTESERYMLIEERTRDIKTFKPGIVKISLEKLPPELPKVALADNFNIEPPNPPNVGLAEADLPPYGLVLGSYSTMHSPGIITFYQKNIEKYCGSLTHKMLNSGFDCNLVNCLYAIFFVVEKTWLHECLHYYCDYKRQFTKSTVNRNLEEAFAVAHSKLVLGASFRKFELCYGGVINIFRNNLGVRYLGQIREIRDYLRDLDTFLQNVVYNDYTLPGYRDWSLYNRTGFYRRELYNYLKDSQLENMRLNNNVPVDDFIRNELYMLRDKGAEIYISLSDRI